MIKLPRWTRRIHPFLTRLQNACRSWLQSRPPWDLPSSVKWLMYAGLFMYSRNLNGSDGIWEWGESYFGIPVPTLMSSPIQEGFIAACLLVSFIFLVEPLMSTRWSKRVRTVRKQASWILIDGILSWFAYALGMLPIISANSDWWGGRLVFLLGALLLLAISFKITIDVCSAYKDFFGRLLTARR